MYWPLSDGWSARQMKNWLPPLSTLDGRARRRHHAAREGPSRELGLEQPQARRVPYGRACAGSFESGSPPWMIPPAMMRWNVVPS